MCIFLHEEPMIYNGHDTEEDVFSTKVLFNIYNVQAISTYHSIRL